MMGTGMDEQDGPCSSFPRTWKMYSDYIQAQRTLHEILLCQQGAALSRAVKVFQFGITSLQDIIFRKRTWTD